MSPERKGYLEGIQGEAARVWYRSVRPGGVHGGMLQRWAPTRESKFQPFEGEGHLGQVDGERAVNRVTAFTILGNRRRDAVALSRQVNDYGCMLNPMF